MQYETVVTGIKALSSYKKYSNAIFMSTIFWLVLIRMFFEIRVDVCVRGLFPSG